MAQNITCDLHNREHEAAWMLQQLGTPNVLGLCDEALLGYCVQRVTENEDASRYVAEAYAAAVAAIAEQQANAEADAAAAEAKRKLSGTSPKRRGPSSRVSGEGAEPDQLDAPEQPSPSRRKRSTRQAPTSEQQPEQQPETAAVAG